MASERQATKARVRSPEWYEKNMPEILPDDVYRIELPTVQAAAFSIYLAVFAGRTGWAAYGMKFPSGDTGVDRKSFPLFWDAPILREFFENGRIYEGKEESDGSVSLYMKESDFVAYLSSWSQTILNPSDPNLSKSLQNQKDYTEALAIASQIPEIIAQWTPSQVDRYVRFVSPFSIKNASLLYADLDDPNNISIGVIDGKKTTRLTSNSKILPESRITSIARTNIIERGNAEHALRNEAMQEGIEISSDAGNAITQLCQTLNNERLIVLGDIASIHSGSGESLRIYKLMEIEILKTIAADVPEYLVYYTNKEATVTYGARRFLAMLNTGLMLLQSKVRYMFERNIDWEVTGVPDLRLVIARLKK